MKPLKTILIIIAILIITLFTIRLILPREIDDITPGISCEKELINKADVLWIVPKFNNQNITEFDGWCKEILSYNKELGLHGVYHNYNEFSTPRNKTYIQEGIDIFEECFKFKPQKFKPPQLAINKENKKLITSMNLNLKLKSNQLFHKVYHCEDTGIFPNWMIDIF